MSMWRLLAPSWTWPAALVSMACTKTSHLWWKRLTSLARCSVTTSQTKAAFDLSARDLTVSTVSCAVPAAVADICAVTVFLQHLGIASSDLSFRPGKKDPVYHYHSIYDSEFWMEKFGDPGFKRHLAASKVLGLAAMRAANSLILPFELRDYAVDLKHYADDARAKAQEATAKHGSFDKVDFDALDQAVAKVGIAVAALNDEIDSVSEGCPHAGPIQKYLKVRHINQRLAKFERNFLDETGKPLDLSPCDLVLSLSGFRLGLDGRPWYKHLGGKSSILSSSMTIHQLCHLMQSLLVDGQATAPRNFQVSQRPLPWIMTVQPLPRSSIGPFGSFS